MEIDLYIVDKEIHRRTLYIAMLEDLINLLKDTGLNKNYIRQIPLRYFYNKIAVKKSDTGDPLMIAGRHHLSDKQIRDDLIYSNVDVSKADEIIELIESHAKNANEILPKLKYKKITPSKQGTKLIVKDISVNDFRNLSDINKEYAFSLALRYQYIALDNHNLAVSYRDRGFKKDCCLEGFATAYNHYFDMFCSPFIDLEFVFGSIGSFFMLKEWPMKFVHVNPPFDAELMSLAVYKVLDSMIDLEEGYTFSFILPNWMDLQSFQDLVNSEWTVVHVVHKKGDLPFVDYHKNPNKLIYPCDILEVILKT